MSCGGAPLARGGSGHGCAARRVSGAAATGVAGPCRAAPGPAAKGGVFYQTGGRERERKASMTAGGVPARASPHRPARSPPAGPAPPRTWRRLLLLLHPRPCCAHHPVAAATLPGGAGEDHSARGGGGRGGAGPGRALLPPPQRRLPACPPAGRAVPPAPSPPDAASRRLPPPRRRSARGEGRGAQPAGAVAAARVPWQGWGQKRDCRALRASAPTRPPSGVPEARGSPGTEPGPGGFLTAAARRNLHDQRQSAS